MTDPLGQSQVIPYLGGLQKEGHEIYLLSAEKDENYSKYRSDISRLLEGLSIHWVPIMYTKMPPVLSTIRDIKTLTKKAIQLHKEVKFDFTHCRSYIAALVGLKLKKKFGLPFIFDMRGFWADERVDGKIWDISKFPFNRVYKYFKKKEIEFLKEAAHTISLTYAGKKEIESWKDAKDFAPITVIPCCADLDHFDFRKYSEEDRATERARLGIEEDVFVLGYLGSIGTWYMLPEMLQSFKEIQEAKKAKMVFITKDDPKMILSEAEQQGVHIDDIIIESSERAELPRKLTAWDASIFYILPAYSKTASSPTKQAELLGMGIPIICNAGVGDTTEILGKEKAGIVLEERNSLLKKIDLMNIEKNHLRRISTVFFSLEMGAEKYRSIYKKLINR
jgi:glycosyltransferase involved in cell wall biosynthesis